MPKPVDAFKRDSPELVAALKRQGWTIDQSRSGHLHFLNENGVLRATHSGTSSDWRGIKNLEAELRRAGLQLGPPPKRVYVAPKEIPLPKNTVVVSAATVAGQRTLADTYGEFMNLGEIERALDLLPHQVKHAIGSNLFGPHQVGVGHQRGVYFLTSTVEDFRNADYRELYPVRKGYKKRGLNVGPRKYEALGAAAVEKVYEKVTGPAVVSHKMSMTLTELASAVERAIVPKIRAEVLAALREYHRER